MLPDYSTDRDFRGYGSNPPAVRWPNEARLAVNLVINVEEGGELSIGQGDEKNESIYEVVEEIPGVRDLCMESHFEYGTRAGWRRIRQALKAHGAKGTVNAIGRSLMISPWLVQEAVADGHEIAAHGWRWERHANMTIDEERLAIARTVEAITRTAGTPPRGWHTRSATSPNTRRLLIEQGGFFYDSNAYNDDLPYLVDVDGRDHLVVPYSFDTNDMRFTRGGGFVFGDDFARYCIDAFDRLYDEGGSEPRMMTVGLHLRIIGKPGRIGGLERFLAHVASKPGVWFARRDEIARHWLKAIGREELIGGR
ncbi:allantoinase PuuE [Bosea sp. BH3]|uniref:allantoinase PuuE n=1 Tax=Bosea sp. BH3 TaxID=2871701 RepID=UPI0021CB95EF|nr:allantoinase PuuE [Bosea sp. BH3]MCU4180316.1 allantoinase PuuE [Bosea sp. BH3]